MKKYFKYFNYINKNILNVFLFFKKDTYNDFVWRHINMSLMLTKQQNI